ncbi:MAG: hypothetical protein EBU72_13770 [Betaproteobacteria bacterium]|nr:hypothetical protein [Betaproteobacteria bacterium]
MLHLMRTVAGADVVVPPGIPMPVYDFHIPLMSLPRAFGITPSTITASIPYLEVPLGKAEQWRSKIEASFFNVGICWQASSKGVEVGRGIPLSAFAPLADCAGVRLYSLQKLDIEVARQPESLSLPLITFGPSFDSEVPFADTAGLMANLDLVITTDTSVAHLAGALGVPVWVALPYVCDWRWGPQSATSPWYPTMRLFRQMERGSWEGCFEQIRWALVKELRARS